MKRVEEFLRNHIGVDHPQYQSYFSILNGYDDWLQDKGGSIESIKARVDDTGILEGRKRFNVDNKRYLAVVLFCKYKMNMSNIGRIFNMNHSSILNLLKTYAELHDDTEFVKNVKYNMRLYPVNKTECLYVLNLKFGVKSRDRSDTKQIRVYEHTYNDVLKYKNDQDIDSMARAIELKLKRR